MKRIGFLIAFFVFAGANAQEVTDYDLNNFAKAYVQMVKLNTKAQNEMAKLIEKEGLDLDTYHAIDESRDSEFEPDVPEEDFVKYDKLQPKIKKIQSELEEDVEKVFEKNDLTKQKYRAISERVKQDYLLQAKLQKILENIR
ncbi:MAG: DUF4168 domain-containing protein [Flavobacteriia bacterium]|nr:DUF4168 domain-containing protein [Flavobacteriia bacterium]